MPAWWVRASKRNPFAAGSWGRVNPSSHRLSAFFRELSSSCVFVMYMPADWIYPALVPANLYTTLSGRPDLGQHDHLGTWPLHVTIKISLRRERFWSSQMLLQYLSNLLELWPDQAVQQVIQVLGTVQADICHDLILAFCS